MAQTVRGPEPMSELTSSEWQRFKKQFLIYLTAAEKDNAEERVKIALFLNHIGNKGVKIYSLKKAKKKETLDSVIQVYENYCEGCTNVIFERYRFRQIAQKEGQSFKEFVYELNDQAERCDFKEEDNMVRDAIVFGVSSNAVRKELLKCHDLTLEKAEKVGETAEITENRANIMSTTDNREVGALGTQRKPVMTNEKSSGSSSGCKWCGSSHMRGKCPAYGKKCNHCGKFNHFSTVCRLRSSSNDKFYRKNVNELQRDENQDYCSDEPAEIGVLSLASRGGNKSWTETGRLNGMEIELKVDTGAQVNVISFKEYSLLKNKPVMEPSHTIIEAFGAHQIKPIGKISVKLLLRQICANVDFLVVNYSGMAILGLTDSIKFELLNCYGNKKINVVEKLDYGTFIEKNKQIFEGLGKIPYIYHIKLKDGCCPVIRPPRRIPFRLKDRLKLALDELEKKQVISKVQKPTNWVNNLVIAEKKDGSLRLCLDPKFLNQAIERERSYIPTREDIKVGLAGKSVFTVLDMKDGFHHIPLDEESSDLCTFSTPFGRYKFCRMPFGICSAPEVFQKIVMTAFENIKGVTVYFDDIIISSDTEDEHDEILKQVIDRATKWGIKFNKSKIQYKQSSVRYVGLIFSGEGVSADSKHLEALKNMPHPKNVKDVQTILGMASYLHEFIPNLSEITASLRNLIKKDQVWKWGTDEIQSFEALKKAALNSPVLGIFDATKEVSMYVDASGNGLGCVLMQENRPIAYGSRSLSETEKKYAQIEKELLAVYFGCKHFHTYIYGGKVKIYTDHKPLITIFKREINQTTARLQRILLALLPYEIELVFVSGKKNLVADPLSRLCLPNGPDENDRVEAVHEMFLGPDIHLQITKKKLQQLKNATMNDPTLSKVILSYIEGWPDRPRDMTPEVKHFYKIQDDILCGDQVVFYKGKVVIPPPLREELLENLHAGHTGIEKTKAKARDMIYWPGMNNDIERYVKSCAECSEFQRANVKEPLLPHQIPPLPFNKLGIDIGQIANKNYLVVFDYYSKWLEVIHISSKIVATITTKLKEIFSRFGIPREIVSDNVPFNSWEFRKFAEENDIELTFISPKHSQSNGLAEKGVGIAKQLLRKIHYDDKKLWYALLEYRNTPIVELGASPAQLLSNRRLRTKIPLTDKLLHPEIPQGIETKVNKMKERQAFYYNKNAKSRDHNKLSQSENVLLRDGRSWKKMQMVGPSECPRSYLIKGEEGRILKRNSKLLKTM